MPSRLEDNVRSRGCEYNAFKQIYYEINVLAGTYLDLTAYHSLSAADKPSFGTSPSLYGRQTFFTRQRTEHTCMPMGANDDCTCFCRLFFLLIVPSLDRISLTFNLTGRWGVVIDAGSSGTRAFIYKWMNMSSAHGGKGIGDHLPELTLVKAKKTHPGISTFAARPVDISHHLEPLIDAAMKEIPASRIPDTPIFVLATAGMRLVPEAQRLALLQETCLYLRRSTEFYLPDCDRHIKVIPGETEGLYGWLAANYLLGGFDPAKVRDGGTNQETYGFLDMGGASTQIVFAPNATEAAEHWDDLKLVRLRNLDGSAKEHKVFSTSFLGFGAHVARQRYVEALEELYLTNDTNVLPDPCMPNGLKTTTKGDPVTLDDTPTKETILLGTGDFQECLRQTFPLLRKDALCEDAPCLFNGQHTPAIDFDVTRFVGVSEYWHVTHGVFSGGSGRNTYDLASYKESVLRFCNQDWPDIQQGLLPRKKDSARKIQDAQEACFKASWLINILYEGIGVPTAMPDVAPTTAPNVSNEAAQSVEDGTIDPFVPVNKIRGTEFSWTLGAMLLHVSGQVPSTDASLPVGFGSNVPGIGADFESSEPAHDTGEAGDAGTLPGKIQARSKISMLLLTLVGVGLLILLFCGRDRRRRLIGKLAPTSRRRRRLSGLCMVKWARAFSRAFFKRDPTAYERLLEEGPRGEPGLYDAGDESDDSAAQQSSSSLGLHTFKDSNERIGDRTVDSSIDRSGLVVRTDSRDRLAHAAQINVGRRSRAGSPTR